MKVKMVMKWDGVTPAQYEQVRKIANWEGDRPNGSLFHSAGFNEGGMHVTDIWESAEDFNNFVQHRLMPAVAQVGIQGQPQVDVLPLHALYVPDASQLN